MKKKLIVAASSTLLIAAVVFSGISFKPTSLKELKAKAQVSGCKTNSTTDCYSSATGNIYSGYEAF